MLQNKPFKISISSVEDEKIFLKVNYNWASCLNANYSEKNQKYYLNKDYLNLIKLRKLFDFSFDNNLFLKLDRDYRSSLEFLQLRPYQEEDVKFLSQKKKHWYI